MPLNMRQERFVTEYLIDFNMAKAMVRAGYSAKTAVTYGSRLMRHPEVIAEMKARARAAADATDLTPESVIRELMRIAFADIRTVAAWDGMDFQTKASWMLTDDEAAALSEVSFRPNLYGVSTRVKMHSKLDAMDKLGKYLQMFTDKVDHTHRFSLEEAASLSDAELMALLETHRNGTNSR